MRGFQFAPGDERNSLDVKGGNTRLASVWTLDDVRSAMHQHAERFSVERTLRILHDITGLTPCNSVMQKVQPRLYGALMARYAEEVADRPHMVEDA